MGPWATSLQDQSQKKVPVAEGSRQTDRKMAESPTSRGKRDEEVGQ